MSSSSNNKRLLNNLVIIGIGTILTKMISFIMTPFYSSWLSPSDYGLYDLIVTYMSLAVPCATLQLNQAVYRYAMENRKLARAYFRLALRVVLPMLFVVSLVIYGIMSVLHFRGTLSICFILYFIAYAMYTMASEYLRGNSMLKQYSTQNILVGVLTVVTSIILVKELSFGVEGLLLVFAIAYGISLLVIFIVHKPWKTDEKLDNALLKELLHYSIPLIPNSISWWITNVSDRTVINVIMGSYYNGLYAICCKIPTMLSLIFGIFNLSFQQIAIEGVGQRDQHAYYDELIHKVVRLLFTGSIVILGVTPIIYYNFLKPDYWNAMDCVPVLLCGAIFLSIAQYMGDILLSEKKTKLIGSSTIVAAVFNFVVNLFLIPWIGLMGASLATMLCYVILFGMRLYAIRHMFHMNKLLMTVAKYLVIYCAVAVVTYFVGQNLLWNLVLFMITGIYFLFENRELILRMLKKWR